MRLGSPGVRNGCRDSSFRLRTRSGDEAASGGTVFVAENGTEPRCGRSAASAHQGRAPRLTERWPGQSAELLYQPDLVVPARIGRRLSALSVAEVGGKAPGLERWVDRVTRSAAAADLLVRPG